MEEKKNIEENKQEEDFFIDYEEIDTERLSKLKDTKVVPSISEKDIKGMKKKLDKDKYNSLEDEEKTAIALALESDDLVTQDDIGLRPKSNLLLNDPKYENSDLVLKALNINKKVNTANAALLKLTQMVSIGGIIHIPLWHSGFWVTIKPLTSDDIIRFEIELINELNRIGKITNNLVFSNYMVIFVDVIMSFFKELITDSSLKLNENEDIFDYILINDAPTIALAMAMSMYPHGFQAVIPCNRVKELDENNKPACDFKMVTKIDLSKLLWVDFSKLSINHKMQMSKKLPNSVTVKDVLNYQETLECVSEKVNEYTIEDNKTTIVIKTSNLTRYFTSGRQFINDLRDKANELITNSDQFEKVEQAEHLILSAVQLHLYNHYVKEIPVDNVKTDDLSYINQALTILSSNTELYSKIIKDIETYIDDSLVSIVGIPNFVCPNCKKEQVSKTIIPLSVYDYFFILLLSRYEKVTQKMLGKQD